MIGGGAHQELHQWRSEAIATWQFHSERGQPGPPLGTAHRRVCPWDHLPQQTHRRFKSPCPHRSPHWYSIWAFFFIFETDANGSHHTETDAGVPHLKEGDVPPQGGKPGWAALPNPRIGPWLRLLKNIASSHNLVPEFEVSLSLFSHLCYIVLLSLCLSLSVSEWSLSKINLCVTEM